MTKPSNSTGTVADPVEAKVLTADVAALREEFYRFKAELLTPDQYIRYERLPQLVGTGIDHVAGSEEVNALPDRWEYIHPTGVDGEGSNTWGTTALFDSAAAPLTKNVIDVEETGKLIGIGVYIVANTTRSAATETVQSQLWLQVDGGTVQEIDLHTLGGGVTSNVGFDLPTLGPFRVYGDPSDVNWGDHDGDAIYIPFNFEYETSLKVDLRIESAADWDPGSELLAIFVRLYRARLVSA